MRRSSTSHRGLPMALLGGPGSGKSALFQAMVYRVIAHQRAGALASLIGPGPARVRRLEKAGRLGPDETERVATAYERWQGLDAAGREIPADYYRLELPYRTGWLGRSVARLELDLCHRTPSPAADRITLRQARVLIFVVPLWALIPRRDRSAEDAIAAQGHLEALSCQIHEATEARNEGGERASKMLLLTMADDPRCGLTELQEAWIYRAVEGHKRHLKRLRRPRHLLTYLDNARRVSDFLHNVLLDTPTIAARIPNLLEFEGDPAWLLPVSALDGRAARLVAEGHSPPQEPPVPAHVELPLLLALCEHAEALL